MPYANVQQHPRFKVITPVDVRFARDELKTLQTEDVSMGGLFIRSDVLRPPGSRLFIRVRSEKGAFTAQARVVHALDEQAAQQKSHAAGMGVVFDGLSGRAVTTLEQLIQTAQEQQQSPRRAAPVRQAMRRGVELLRQAWLVLVGLLMTLHGQARAALRSPDAPPEPAETPWYHRVKLPAPPVTNAEAHNAQLDDLLLLAQEHEDRGDMEEARQTLLCALTLAPEHREVTTRLQALEARLAQVRKPPTPFDVM